jgi:hypothetical protein
MFTRQRTMSSFLDNEPQPKEPYRPNRNMELKWEKYSWEMYMIPKMDPEFKYMTMDRSTKGIER